MAGSANNGTQVIILGWILLGLSTAVIAGRFYARVRRLGRTTLDDWMMLCAWLAEVVHMIVITVGWHYGMGRHFLSLDPQQQELSLKWTILVETFAISSSTFGRISFAIFFLQIIGPRDRIFKYTLWGVIAVQVLANLVTLVQIYAQCGTHARALWDPAAGAAYGHCQNPSVQTIIGYVQSALNSLCDAVLTIIPVMVLWNLQMPRNQKLSLGLALTLSFFALGASIAKCVEIRSLAMKGDITWYFMYLMLCVVIENNVVIIAASIPTLRPLARKTGNSSSATKAASGGQNAYNNWPESERPQQDFYSRSNIRSDVHATGDESSEHHILEEVTPAGDKIMKTTKVHVAYERWGEDV